MEMSNLTFPTNTPRAYGLRFHLILSLTPGPQMTIPLDANGVEISGFSMPEVVAATGISPFGVVSIRFAVRESFPLLGVQVAASVIKKDGDNHLVSILAPEYIPVVLPGVCSIATGNVDPALNLAHGTITRGGGAGAHTASGQLLLHCSKPENLRVSIIGKGDLTTNLSGVTSTIAFDGSNYERQYNNVPNIPLPITVTSTVKWTAGAAAGPFSASGTVLMEVL
ncbi:hypothetical protein SME22J_08850 [Serratia marcescens]|nr:hypothetical protein SME22J_08850 [Serratia marcescens]